MKIQDWLAAGPHAIDGGLSGELEKRGHDLSDSLWSARLLRDAPEAIAAVHADYVAAGAKVLITASYQASRVGFAEVGLSHDEADELMRRSIELAREVATPDVLIAASVGPYGAVLGGGQEYHGNYGLSHEELVAFHTERIAVLAQAKPDLFACETIPDIVEVKALVEVLANFGIPAWISMSCKDGAHTCAGQPIEELAAAVAGSAEVVAIGVNCTMPEFVGELVGRLGAVSDLPMVVYPNAGRVWDGAGRCWIGEGLTVIPEIAVDEWVAAGVKLVGGCCGLGPQAIAALQLRD